MKQPNTPWDRRVQFRAKSTDAGFAYRPNEVIAPRRALGAIATRLGREVDDLAVDLVIDRRVAPVKGQQLQEGDDPSPEDLVLVRGVPDPVAGGG